MSRYIDASKLVKDGWSLQRTKHSLTSSTYEVMGLDCVPTADVRENIKGKWKIEYAGDGWNDYIDVTCTNCGKTIRRGEPFNFCPNCGAQMMRGGDA